MPGSCFRIYIHINWAAKNRGPWLTPGIESSVIAIIKAKAESQKAKVIAIGNTLDHIHVLVSIHPDTHIALMIKEMKSASSYYVNHNLGKALYWQEGYFAISVSPQGIEKVRRYVENQKIHHENNSTIDYFEMSSAD